MLLARLVIFDGTKLDNEFKFKFDRLGRLPAPSDLAQSVAKLVPNLLALLINAPMSLVIAFFKLLVIVALKLDNPVVLLLTAPDANDPTLVNGADNKLANGVFAIDEAPIAEDDKVMPVAALTADIVCNPLCV